MNNPALQFFQRRYENIRLAARGADVALLSDADGYVTYGQDADRLVEAMKRRVLPTTLGTDEVGPFRTVILTPDKVAEAVKVLTEAGWSVALIDRATVRLVAVAIVPAVKAVEVRKEEWV